MATSEDLVPVYLGTALFLEFLNRNVAHGAFEIRELSSRPSKQRQLMMMLTDCEYLGSIDSELVWKNGQTERTHASIHYEAENTQVQSDNFIRHEILKIRIKRPIALHSGFIPTGAITICSKVADCARVPTAGYETPRFGLLRLFTGPEAVNFDLAKVLPAELFQSRAYAQTQLPIAA